MFYMLLLHKNSYASEFASASVFFHQNASSSIRIFHWFHCFRKLPESSLQLPRNRKKSKIFHLLTTSM